MKAILQSADRWPGPLMSEMGQTQKWRHVHVAVFGAALRQAMRLAVRGRYADFIPVSVGTNVADGSEAEVAVCPH